VRIPYKKIATQAANSNEASMQFVYCSDTFRSGEAIWACTIDCTDGSIIAEVNITPTISGTPYKVLHPLAFETYGGNTQIMYCLAKAGAEANHTLFKSTNGGGTWTSMTTGDFQRVYIVPPLQGGNGSKIWLSGLGGLYYSTNSGTTLQLKDNGGLYGGYGLG
jgi:hypothetical protein